MADDGLSRAATRREQALRGRLAQEHKRRQDWTQERKQGARRRCAQARVKFVLLLQALTVEFELTHAERREMLLRSVEIDVLAMRQGHK